nr:glycoside hydrolase family 95 protein [Colletotrichum truncatum]KAF6789544.1 glycoside hydrolase family 95 protein [Colletotrichum truncatum]
MKFDSIARVNKGAATTECTCAAALKINPVEGQKTLTIIIGAETNYDQKKGNAENNYSFKGEDPGPVVERATNSASAKSFDDILKDHIADFQALEGAFELNLPDSLSSEEKETGKLITDYVYTNGGDPFVEALLFDYSRYLLITSSRENSLPANLQGRWTEQLYPAWSADYHANINLQMNYWVADQTGLDKTQVALWNYMADTWVPRGTETARLLYNADGWVVHNEINTFGHTAMKEGASWANYAAAGAWMMQHVWDNFEYTQDLEWFKRQGYPLIKGVAEFWLSQLQEDLFFNDGSLVVNPCNSPETGPTTFGCTHYHQQIHQVFEAVIHGASLVSESDAKFLDSVASSLERLDKGVHITEWGGLKEWKLPDSYGYDAKSTHRHLSHLTGWHPGYSVSSFLGGYTNSTIQSAVQETLISRGMGNAEDANAGWAKVWRAACWARLNNTEKAYEELRYAIDVNFAPNGFSMYWAMSPPFQIDANFGLGGAVLSMLVVDLPLPYASKDELRTVVLGPAIPKKWGGGSVKGLRIRGGGVVDFSWNDDGIVTEAVGSSSTKGAEKVRLVNIEGAQLAVL